MKKAAQTGSGGSSGGGGDYSPTPKKPNSKRNFAIGIAAFVILAFVFFAFFA